MYESTPGIMLIQNMYHAWTVEIARKREQSLSVTNKQNTQHCIISTEVQVIDDFHDSTERVLYLLLTSL